VHRRESGWFIVRYGLGWRIEVGDSQPISPYATMGIESDKGGGIFFEKIFCVVGFSILLVALNGFVFVCLPLFL
jgi:hypothetical protein